MGKVAGTIPGPDFASVNKPPLFGSIPTWDLNSITQKKITLKRKEITSPTLMRHFKKVTIPDGQIVSYSYGNPWKK